MGDRIFPNEICSILKPEEGTSSVSAVLALLVACVARGWDLYMTLAITLIRAK